MSSLLVGFIAFILLTIFQVVWKLRRKPKPRDSAAYLIATCIEDDAERDWTRKSTLSGKIYSSKTLRAEIRVNTTVLYQRVQGLSIDGKDFDLSEAERHALYEAVENFDAGRKSKQREELNIVVAQRIIDKCKAELEETPHV